MDNTKLTMEIDYPILATKGVALFPHNDISIEAGRVFSKRAIRKANESFNGYIFMVISPFLCNENTNDLESK